MPLDPLSLAIEGVIAFIAVISLGVSLSISHRNDEEMQTLIREEEVTNEELKRLNKEEN